MPQWKEFILFLGKIHLSFNCYSVKITSLIIFHYSVNLLNSSLVVGKFNQIFLWNSLTPLQMATYQKELLWNMHFL